MSKQSIEHCIKGALKGDAKKNALELASYFRTVEIIAERETTGYWADKIYWNVSYKNESICNIAIDENQDGSWYITGDDSESNWFENPSLDKRIKEVIWKNVVVCDDYASCGGCGSPDIASRKVVFGKAFNRVCLITLKFNNPDAETIACIKKIFELRKNDILKGFEGEK